MSLSDGQQEGLGSRRGAHVQRTWTHGQKVPPELCSEWSIGTWVKPGSPNSSLPTNVLIPY